MRIWKCLALIAAILGLEAAALRAENPIPAPRPNIMLILADDLGWSDLGCYGGEIQTPILDQLATRGLRFTQFYNSARCCPSRASILTGLYPHQAGFPGMSGSLPPNCATIPERLRTAGYQTFMSGKWHLGQPGPIKRGFDEYFGMLGGYGSFWNPQLYTRLPAGRPERNIPEGSFYATDVITDYALEFIAQARKTAARPYFLYLAYNAPHFPLHAPKAEIAKYAKLYEQGWDKIRSARFARQKQLGLVDEHWACSPRSTIPPNPVATMHDWANKPNPDWDSLSADRRADLARRMAIYAGAVDRMDQNIGRVVADLKQHGELDKTLILFLSDNGACAEWDPFGFDVTNKVQNVNLGTTSGLNLLHRGADLETMGAPGTYISYGSGWANACNTPFRLYKHYSHEGGITTPLIAHWPAGLKRTGELDHRVGHIADLMATCLEVAGGDYPKDMLPLAGRSLMPAILGKPDEPRTVFFEHEGNRGVRSGNWKLVAVGNNPWELYNMAVDRTELNDLAAQQPDRVKTMAAQWDDWARQMHQAGHWPEKRNPAKAKSGLIQD